MPWMDTLGSRLKFAREKRGLSQPALAKLVGITFQSIQAIEAGGGTKHINAIARALRVRARWLEDGVGPMELDEAVTADTQPASASDELEMIGPTKPRPEKDTIPVRAARGGPGDVEMFVDDDPIDYRPRPTVLEGVDRPYSMWVAGASMAPVVKTHTTLHVNPHLRANPGDLVIVWKRNNAVIIKELVRRTDAGTILKEYNGTVEGREFVVARADIVAMHKVVGMDLP